jgi:hypothetical protein
MLSAPQLGNPHADDATALASASRPALAGWRDAAVGQ